MMFLFKNIRNKVKKLMLLSFLISILLLPNLLLAQEEINSVGSEKTSFIYSKKAIKQKAEDVAKQIEIYINLNPDKTVEDLQKDEYFQEIAVQLVGKTGYTAITDADILTCRFHSNPNIVDLDLSTLANKLPGFWDIMSLTKGGYISEGVYDWEESDGTIREKYMYIALVKAKTFDGVTLTVAATTYLDEYHEIEIFEENRILQEKINSRRQLFILIITIFLVFLLFIGLLFKFGNRIPDYLSTWTIGKKIFLLILLIVLAASMVMLIGFYNVNKIQNNFDELEKKVTPMAVNVSEMNSFIYSLKSWMLTYVLVGDDQRGEKTVGKWIKDDIVFLESTIDKQLKLINNLEDKDRLLDLQKIQVDALKANSIIEKIIIKKNEGMPLEKLLLIARNEYRPLFFRLSSALAEDKEFFLSELNRLDSKNVSDIEDMKDIVLLLFLIVVVVIFSISLYLAYSITKPIRQLYKITTEVRKGNLNIQTDIRTKDEFGKLGTNFNLMIKDLLRSKTNIEKKVEERTSQLEKLNKSMVGRELRMRELKEKIRALKNLPR
ncbi:HAMP domain-containing protein [bacterium]|nr:HAMP domain-containing protein [bacterium]